MSLTLMLIHQVILDDSQRITINLSGTVEVRILNKKNNKIEFIYY